ncbi:hypothetical protein [Paraburkholderia sp. J41]|uniref:hypothetical protein n=1 Tax=Paraburkholderia sp. J41 TaxID=2805433 RepID=UPI002AC355DA|nr:hypothetical protein [Paraburkholderia sp. J41]
MYTTKPCTTTCVIDGAPVTFTYYPDTCVLRVCNAAGQCLREDRWEASWAQLLATIREIAVASAEENAAQPGAREPQGASANDRQAVAA